MMANTHWSRMLEVLDTYDWEEAFGYAGEPGTDANSEPTIGGALPGGNYNLSPFTREDVAELYGTREGENDEESWLAYGKLRDGRHFYLEAWCDYTGWDCQAGGSVVIANSREELVRFGLDEESRRIFEVTL